MRNTTRETLNKMAKRENTRTTNQKIAQAKNFNQCKVTSCKTHNPSATKSIKIKGGVSYWDRRYAEISTY